MAQRKCPGFSARNAVLSMPANCAARANSSWPPVETVSNAGSARLVDGSTGVEIQAQLGDQVDDLLCRDGITVLSNNARTLI